MALVIPRNYTVNKTAQCFVVKEQNITLRRVTMLITFIFDYPREMKCNFQNIHTQ